MQKNLMKGLNPIILSLLTSLCCQVAFAIEIIAHRGGTEGRFEASSLEAFNHSAELGIQTLESDLHLTADDQIVLAHDPILSPGGVLVSKTNLADLKARFPHLLTLQDVAEFSQKHPSIQFQLEIKHYSPWEKDLKLYKPLKYTIQVIMNELNRLQLVEKVTISSFNENVLSALRQSNPRLKLKYNYRGLYYGNYLGNIKLCQKICFWPRWDDAIQFVWNYKIDVFAPNLLLMTHPVMRTLNPVPELLKSTNSKELGFKIHVWTVNDLKSFEKLKAYRVDGIITDYPAAFKKAIRFQLN